ncbi:Serine/threonine-protein kinase bur-1 [Ophiocordyceps camponoti-floridani]|uniref:Serine/threonine-protein kinase BUR1 n=1 Tax=Ophiocordyceps camponoti-floridani TaxID=2030778 RepID=A0A8H4Q4M2_9HYPO|nr:Serine/threonine-protein kinase bur-1 [Ophiocordyceps camponoti-floridani]
MERPPENTPHGTSPRTFALNHLRPKNSFHGCSRITDYELQGKLGEGTFGEVHRARSKRTGALVALKKIIMHHEKDGFPITALREIKLLKLLSHHNILRLEDMAVEHSSRPSDKRKKPIMYMVTPYMDHDLSGLLDNPSVHFKEAQVKCYMKQLLKGLCYLHDNHILHRDMKAANLLINNKGILQIADFGLARHYDGPSPQPGRPMGEGRRDYTGLVVTRWYRPPELLLQLRQYTTAIDVWGVGCVFGEMLVGKPILAGENDAHQLELIWDLMGSPTDENMPGWKQLPGGDHLSPRHRPGNIQNRFREFGSGAVALLRELLKLNWRNRINAVDALEHPYFKMAPLPMEPHDIPMYEESHELDRRKFHDRKAALPPAPKGGTVGVGPDVNGATAGFNSSDGYGQRTGANGGRYRGGPGPDERRPAWQRDRGPPARPPPDRPANRDEPEYRDRGAPRSRVPSGGVGAATTDGASEIVTLEVAAGLRSMIETEGIETEAVTVIRTGGN